MLSVCDVGILWPNGWMYQDETSHGSRPQTGHIVLDGNLHPPKKGAQHIVAKRLNGSRCHLVRRSASAQATFC